MSHTIHGAKGLHKQAAIDHKTAEHDQFDRKATEHHEHIAVAAYFHAEHRGFNGGDPVADWQTAETEINAALNKDENASIH